MAEQNKSAATAEILSPSELFAARSRSHKIPLRGQKDFYPDDSEQQRQRLQHSLDEHWELVSEERVERLGNLVTAVWIPSDRTVELQSPAGKFWQTMGFSSGGKQFLHPEEALYLMECGNLQVFDRGAPLSIQEGYELFLTCHTVSLQQYQVFGHLKRLGYVVTRFHARVPSAYQRRLNLSTQLKRKRSSDDSPTQAPEEAAHPGAAESRPCPVEGRPGAAESRPCPAESRPGAAEGRLQREARHPGWWGAGREQEQEAGGAHSSCTPRWDYSTIQFPDLGAGGRSGGGSGSLLASPDPSLLPGALAVGACDTAPWLRRLNRRRVQTSGREWRHAGRPRGHPSVDGELRRCSTWAEYLQLLEGRRSSQRRRSNRPAHLWEGSVTPLHDPNQYTCTAEILEKISVVKSSCHSEEEEEEAPRLQASSEWTISFDVYQPDTEFRKSCPGTPYSRMCVCSFEDPVPDLGALRCLSSQSGDVPVTMAIVDQGDISFYTFKDFSLPCDVSLLAAPGSSTTP